ncbi:MAG: hypothetical protein ACJAXT_002253 [Paracoccaceae bacterium]|jgi:hypothetical protein
MRKGIAFVIATLFFTGTLLANAPDRSPWPMPRPTAGPVIGPITSPVAVVPLIGGPNDVIAAGPMRVVVVATNLAPRHSLRPQVRGGDPVRSGMQMTPPVPPEVELPPVSGADIPSGLFDILPTDDRATASAATRVSIVGSSSFAVRRSLRPQVRPEGLEQRVRAAATRITPGRVTQTGRRGQLCGLPGVIGDELDTIPGRISGCGIPNPVRIREIDGVALNSPATVNCQTAEALQDWLQDSVVPTVGRRGGGVTSIRVVASYACRTRNNRPGARISEHGQGNAVDVAGIGLADGQEITVLSGWRSGQSRTILREVHRDACGPFGTVLGPDADRYHQDHFHLDTASHRSGPYCR